MLPVTSSRCSLHDPVDSDFHRQARARGEEAATEGPRALAASLAEAREQLEAHLDAASTQRVIEVRDGICLLLAEYLKARLIKLVVHLDDLAVSIGHEGPEELPAQSYDVAAAVLAQVATRRAGRLATGQSLARRERSPTGVHAL